MRDGALDAIRFIKGRTREELQTDRMLLLSLVKSIEIIGEAASKISAESRNELPDIPWKDIITMRNRLIHAYFDIDQNVVWDTVTADLPPLVATLEKFAGK